ncbi:MAG: S41 family peptidase [Sedimentisphaerales bacterium]
MKKAILILAILFTPTISRSILAVQPNLQDDKKTCETLTKEDRIFGLVEIYSTAKQHFAYFERLPNLDWDKTFKEYLPLVEKKQSLLEYYRILQRFIALLEDGHTNVYLPKTVETQLDRLPLRLKYIQDEWVITERMPSKEILKEDIPVGSIVLNIEKLPANEYIEKEFIPYSAHGSIQGKRTAINWQLQNGQKVYMTFKYPDGSVHSRIICANRKTIKWNDELRKKYTSSLRLGPDFSTKQLENNILYVRYRECTKEIQGKFCRLIQDMNMPPKAMIIDFRGNTGGSTPTQAIAHLMSLPISWYSFKTRWSISYIDAQMSSEKNRDDKKAVLDGKRNFMKLPEKMDLEWFVVCDSNTQIQPAEKNYNGQLILLIDRETASAAEDMVVMLHAAGRAKVTGEPSFGSTGQPFMLDLPGGGTARICTANCKYTDGREFIGVGIQPDIPVHPTIKGIAEGQDEMLEAAIKYLKNNL